MKLGVVIFTGSLLVTVWIACANAAVRVDAKRKVAEVRAKRAAEFAKRSNDGEGPSLAELLELTPNEGLQVVETPGNNCAAKYKLIETYMGKPVYGTGVVAAADDHGHYTDDVTGVYFQEIELDLHNVQPSINKDEAVLVAKHLNGKTGIISNVKVNEEIYFKEGVAKLAFMVTFTQTSLNTRLKEQPVVNVQTAVDANTGEALLTVKATTTIKAPYRYAAIGGNVKVGKFHYDDEQFPKLNVHVDCDDIVFENEYVTVVDMEGRYESNNSAFRFFAEDGYNDTINGAYSPLADALFFGEAVYSMFKEWYNQPPLQFRLIMRVHFGVNYENAFWDGRQMTFGDGKDIFHPLVSQDVVAHEVAHGFTQQTSNLEYRDESGGMNEAFSDMAGEASKFFVRGSNDYMVGQDIFKKAGGALRYMYDPPLDGVSIGHAYDYFDGLNVHLSSGVFNKMFYILSTTPGWDTKKAFDIMVQANKFYWTETSSFDEGARGVIKAAQDCGCDEDDVKAAFKAVGIVGFGEDEVIELKEGDNYVSCFNEGEVLFKIPSFDGAIGARIHVSEGEGKAWVYDRRNGVPSTDRGGVKIKLDDAKLEFKMVAKPHFVRFITASETSTRIKTDLSYIFPPFVYADETVDGIESTSAPVIYRFELGVGVFQLSFRTWNGSGDPDLFVKYNAMVSPNNYDMVSYNYGPDEWISWMQAQPGTYNIGIYPYTPFSGLSLLVETIVEPDYVDFRCDTKHDVSALDSGESLFGKLQIPPCTQTLNITTFGGQGDADLYVRADNWPTLTEYDYSSLAYGNDELISINQPESLDWFVVVNAFLEVRNATFKALCDCGEMGDEVGYLQDWKRGTKSVLSKRDFK